MSAYIISMPAKPEVVNLAWIRSHSAVMPLGHDDFDVPGKTRRISRNFSVGFMISANYQVFSALMERAVNETAEQYWGMKDMPAEFVIVLRPADNIGFQFKMTAEVWS